MELSGERVGPYVRALRAAVNALAPNEDHVSLSAVLGHLEALDPVLSGTLLAPAEFSVSSGMPAFTWMERAIAEAKLARQGDDDQDPSDAKLVSVGELDPALARRIRDRRELHQHLRRSRLLPTTALGAAVRRLGATTEFSAHYDRMVPDGRWMRIRFDVRVEARRRVAGPLAANDEGQIQIDPALQHFLTRHFADPLTALQTQLGEVTHASIPRLSRSMVGPFWFPGVELPAEVPGALGSGLLLHSSSEVVSEDVRQDRHLDPWLPSVTTERPPDGQKIYRERRLAANAVVLPIAQRWADRLGFRNRVVPIARTARRRL
jgi:hypothetical protein